MKDKVEGEIVLYQPNEVMKLEVRLEDETVWLTQAQMAELFQSTKQNISLHINNVFKERELNESSTVKEYLTVQQEGSRHVKRNIAYYSLDVIISVGYRVKSQRGTDFRIWATGVLKEFLLKGHAVNQRLSNIERKMDEKFMEHEQRLTHAEEKIDFFVRTSLPPVEGVFYNGQIFDAYKFAADLIKLARQSLILIDNYIDETVLTLLSKRERGVTVTIYTSKVTTQLLLDADKHNEQYPPVSIHACKHCHDRFLIIDNRDVYHIGASLKDLGKKMFAFCRLTLPVKTIMEGLWK